MYDIGGGVVEQQKLEQYMEQYSVYLLKLAMVYVKDKQVAEDIVQEVFIQLYYGKNYEERGQVKSYLSTLIVNRCKNYLKSWSYRMLQFKDSFVEKAAPSSDAVIISEERSLIGKVIFKLPVKYREMIFFYYYEELKIQQIAELLQIPDNTVKTRLRKARSLLQQELPQQQWEVLDYERYHEEEL